MSDSTHLPIVLIGGGGHAAVLVDILLSQGRDIVAVVSPDEIDTRTIFSGIERFSQEKDILQFSSDGVVLVNGIGMVPKSNLRKTINEYYLSLGYRFESVVSGSAIISSFANLGAGVQILNGAIVQAGANIGPHTIINTAAIVEHDCEIGPYNHISPSATICGGVATSLGVYIGAGAVITPNLKLGLGCVVGAGTTILNCLSDFSIQTGQPPRKPYFLEKCE